MLNCGFYPVDIGTLKHSEYKDGRITRKRSKTRNRSDKVPTVSYRLWKETDTLLTKYRSDHPELVLLNRNGTPLWKEVEKNGKFCRISNIKCSFFRLQQKTEITKSLKHLRKTASTMLGSHPQYGRYAEYFLGEAPRSVTDTHYVKPSQDQFDKAVKWLGEQFGFKTEPVRSPVPSRPQASGILRMVDRLSPNGADGECEIKWRKRLLRQARREAPTAGPGDRFCSGSAADHPRLAHGILGAAASLPKRPCSPSGSPRPGGRRAGILGQVTYDLVPTIRSPSCT